jgi:uncharacterized protein DUF4332
LAIQQQFKKLQEEHQQLRLELEALRAAKNPLVEENPAHSHDEFASAIGSAVDSLQMHMSRMSNQVSDFAVREISVQAKVSLEVTSLGVLTYRFIRPGDPIDAQKISTVSLTIVPVPKQDKIGTLGPGVLNAAVGLEGIPGLSEDLRARLGQHNIHTVADFLEVSTRARSAVRLAALLEVDRELLNGWLAQAQLLMLQGMDSQTASLLYEAGIRGLNDLASLTSEDVLDRYERQASAINGPTRKRLNVGQVESWIKIARTYTGTDGPTIANS